MTIAQQLKIKEFPFEIKDPNGNEIYFENSASYWAKREYDAAGKEIYYENSNGYIMDNRPKRPMFRKPLIFLLKKDCW